MDIFIDETAGVGLAEQIYEQIRSGIVEGRLSIGDRLPATRDLAASLQVSRHTVTTAFGRLVAEGYLEGRRGGGTVVAAAMTTPVSRPADVTPYPLDEPPKTPPIVHDMRTGTPDPRLFPAADWKRCAKWAVDQREVEYGDPGGIESLRGVLATWIGRSRGVDATSRQVVVTSGAQHALYLLAAAVLEPGDIVAVEEPGYPPFRRILTSVGARIAPVPVDDEGIVVDRIPTTSRLVYVTPSHQFPTGVTMSMARRVALMALADTHGMTVVEDDYDSEFRYVDRPLEPLFRLAGGQHVAYVGSFSKVLSPALRLGYVVVPPGLLGNVIDLRKAMDWSSPSDAQLTLRGFIVEGHLDRHLRRSRKVYTERHRRMSALMAWAASAGVVQPSLSNAGLHVAGRLVDPGREHDIVGRLGELGIAIEGFSRYSIDPDGGGGLVLGFGRVDAAAIDASSPMIRSVLTG